MPWLTFGSYKHGTGHIELRFDKELKPYLLGLQGYYTEYKLEKVVNFRSGYAMRLFELLKKEEFKKGANGYFKRSFEYDELREFLGINKKEYEYFKDFRVRVIDSSVKEINANPDIAILQVDYPKTGRKVSHIVFHCEKAKQLQLDIDEPPPTLEEVKEHPDDVKQLIAFGISEETAYKWRKKYGVARVIRNLGFVTAKKVAGKVKDDLAGYVASAITKDYGQGWEDKEKTQQDVAASKAEEERKRQREQAQEEARKKEEADALWTSFMAWQPEARDALIRSLLAGKSTTLQIYEKKGESTAVVRSLVVQHLRK
jgi:plasmid replication initiation protein